MKGILLFLLFPSLCFSQTKEVTKGDIVFKGPIYSTGDTSIVADENRAWKDSLNFTVVWDKYKSGSRHVEILKDNQAKIYYWKQFHPNGKLKEEGAMTKDEIICIGSWKFYSEKGNLYKSVNYDTLLTIPYHKAIEIAMKYDFKLPDI